MSNREGDCVRSCPTATAAATIGALRSSTVEPRLTRVFKDFYFLSFLRNLDDDFDILVPCPFEVN